MCYLNSLQNFVIAPGTTYLLLSYDANAIKELQYSLDIFVDALKNEICHKRWSRKKITTDSESYRHGWTQLFNLTAVRNNVPYNVIGITINMWDNVDVLGFLGKRKRAYRGDASKIIMLNELPSLVCLRETWSVGEIFHQHVPMELFYKTEEPFY